MWRPAEELLFSLSTNRALHPETYCIEAQNQTISIKTTKIMAARINPANPCEPALGPEL